jgi:integrase
VCTYQSRTVPTEKTNRLEQAIEATIEDMKLKGTIINKREHQNITSKLRRIARETDIFNPIEVKKFIATKLTLSQRNNNEFLYSNFAQTNQIPYDRTRWKYKPPIPLIPTTENVNTIINASTERFYTPLRIMATIAVEAEELHKTDRDKIDIQKGEISITGTKGHDNGIYKLNSELNENLIHYLSKHQEKYPFPESRHIGDAWRGYRERRAKELNRPELLKIQMKSLRNYAGAVFYLTKGKDPIQTMQFMRHKKLETTLHYLRAIKTFTAKAEYITKAVKLGQPETIDQISELSNQGFEKYTEADGYQIFRIIRY